MNEILEGKEEHAHDPRKDPMDDIHRKERETKLKAQFNKFMKKHLDLKSNHVDADKGIIVDFEYFLKVVTGIFFWKKMRFEHDRLKYIEMRRVMLKEN